MRQMITTTTDALALPAQSLRVEAAAHGGDADYNARAQAEWPCLTTIEMRPPPATLPPPRTLTVAAWNIERCKRVEESADVLRRAGADIVLATEMDHGMARSAQRHTTRDLAAELGMGYLFGTEFVELGSGDAYETSLFQSTPNTGGLHGNAILSRYPLSAPALIPLDAGGRWFVGRPKNDGQLRIGGRMAMAARIETAKGSLSLTSVHYESESTAGDRRAQTDVMLRALASLHGPGACVIGGDLNTKDLMDGTRTGAEVLNNPASIEPSFAAFAEAGFDWRTANTGATTTRPAPGKMPKYPMHILDWLFTRGVSPRAPRVLPALSSAGHYLSDHELILVEITL